MKQQHHSLPRYVIKQYLNVTAECLARMIHVNQYDTNRAIDSAQLGQELGQDELRGAGQKAHVVKLSNTLWDCRIDVDGENTPGELRNERQTTAVAGAYYDATDWLNSTEHS